MPKIPQYTRQVAPSGQGANVRANPAALTQGEAAAVGFGNVLTQEGAYFATKMREAREVSELSSAKIRMIQEFNDLELELANDPDFTTYADRFTKRTAEIHKNASGHITEQNALDAFDSAFDVESEQRRFGIQKLANKKEIGKMTADLNFNVDAAVKAGNYPLIQEMLRGAQLAGIITPEKAEAIRQKSEHKITYEGAWNAALEAPTYEEALEVINKREGLTPSERDALGGHVKRVFDQKEAQDKKVIEGAQEDWRNKALPELVQGKLTFSSIMAAPIDAKEKEHWNGLIEKQSEAIISGKNDPLKITDPAVDWEIMSRIYSANPPTAAEIIAKIGYGLSADRGEKWLEVIKKPSDTGYKRANDYLKSQIMPSKGLLVGESSEDADAYYKAVMFLDEKIKTAEEAKKPLTGNEILKVAMEIAPLYKKTMAEQLESMKNRLKTEKRGDKGREEAIKLLRDNNKEVNEDTIKTVLERLKGKE